jgi:hypothetical protein
MGESSQRRPGALRSAGMRRLVAAVWLVLYALVAVAIPIADAAATHAPVVAHWEDGSDSTCPPRHDPSACQLCQVQCAPGAPPAEPASVPLAEPRAQQGIPDRAARAVAAPPVRIPPSRAPPAA